MAHFAKMALGFVVAVGSVGGLLLACSDSSSPAPAGIVGNDSGSVDGGVDSSTDAGHEEHDSATCGTPSQYPSNACQIDRACSATECGGPGLVYHCQASGNGAQPPITGCTDMGMEAGVEEWCCPSSCVRNVGDDISCGGSTKAFRCPGTMQPDAGCSFRDDAGTWSSYCCP